MFINLCVCFLPFAFEGGIRELFVLVSDQCLSFNFQLDSCGLDDCFRWELHGPSMFAVQAKIYGVLYKQSSSLLLMKHLVIGQRLKTPNFPGFSLVTTR